MLLYLIPGIWVLLLLYVVSRHSFFKINQLNDRYIYSAFLFKLLLGFGNYYIWLHIIGHGDSLRYYHDSLIVYNSLFDNPKYFFELLTRTSLENVQAYLHPYQHELFIEWHVKEYNMVRLMAILNLFTLGNVWGNIVILAFIGFTTSIALFKAILQQAASTPLHRNMLFGITFFLPSVIFWSSGILKEAPVLILLSLIAIQLIKFSSKPPTHKAFGANILIILIALMLLFFIRDYVALLLTINLIIYVMANFVKPFRNNPNISFLFITLTLIVLAITIPLALPQYNYFGYMQQEQSYFLSGEQDPDYAFKRVGNSGIDLIKMIPYALNNVFFRPNILHSHNLFRIYQSLELLALWIAMFICVYRIVKNKLKLLPISVFFIIASIQLLFIYGLMVTDADTLSRYRSIPLFFILLVLYIEAFSPLKKPLTK